MGDLLGIFFEKKSHNAEKTEGGPFSLSRYGMLRGKRGKPFWFSSLGQIFQFETIKFCRTLKTILVSSCGLKKRVTIIVAFHFMKRLLKLYRKEDA